MSPQMWRLLWSVSPIYISRADYHRHRRRVVKRDAIQPTAKKTSFFCSLLCVFCFFFIIFIHVSLSLSQQNRFIIIIGGGWVVVKKKTIDRSRLANICNDKLLECGITQANTNTHLLFSLGLSLFTNRAPRASLKYRNRQGKKKCVKRSIYYYLWWNLQTRKDCQLKTTFLVKNLFQFKRPFFV